MATENANTADYVLIGYDEYHCQTCIDYVQSTADCNSKTCITI